MMSASVTRTVAILAFAYNRRGQVSNGRGGLTDALIPTHAHRGETIELTPEDAERGDAIGAFVVEPDDLSKLKVDELKALADERGVEVPEDAKKADLIALLEDASE